MENINNIFLEVKNYINQDDRYSYIKENLIEDYKELEKIYSYYYKKQSCERMKQQLKVFQSQQQINTEEELSYYGEPYIQQQESTTYQVVASDLHGDISTFLNILVQNKIIDLKDSCEIVDLKMLKSYDTFASFKKKMGKKGNDKIFLDARCVILPKFELNKDVKVTFNYLGDLIDEGRFSIECFYMMMMLMEKAKSCDNFEINYIAGNHEIANIMLESRDIKDHYLRQCTKYYCYCYDKSEYLVRSNSDIRPMPEQSHNFQMGCVAEYSKKLIENGQMKLVHVDGNKVFIHANPSIESILCFLYIDEIKTMNDLNQEIIHYNDIFKNKSYEERLDGYFCMINEVNEVFIKLIADCKLDILDLNSMFFLYIRNSYDITKGGKCPKEMMPLSFFKKLKYFVGHDSGAGLEYIFNGSKLYCLDGHNNNDHRFVKIVGNEINTGLVKSNEFQERYDALQQQFNDLESKIAEKCRQNSLNKDTITLLETGSLLEDANAETDRRCMPKRRSGCFAM